MTAYWIGIASQDHVETAVKGGFAQLGHGKHAAVRNLEKGDGIAYYSPRTTMMDGERVQAFTAIGQIVSERPYQVESGGDFKPYRVDAKYRTSARKADIRPLLDMLSFTRDSGSNWGLAFRRSKIKVDRDDFRIIGEAMGLHSFC